MSHVLALVVTAGPDIGLRLRLDVSPRVVGRANEASLRLTDPAVSRRHVEVAVAGDAARIRALEGAAPFVFDGEMHEEAIIGLHGRFVIGSTMLAVVEEGERSESQAGTLTEARRLVDGAGADVRGLAALFALAEALDLVASNEAALVSAFAEWARNTVGARDVAIVPHEALLAEPALEPLGRGEIVLREIASGGASLFAPARTSMTAGVRFDLPLDVDDVATAVKRMLVVGSRIFVQLFAARLDASSAREENDVLREQAVGSARAFLGTSPAAADVVRVLPRLSASPSTVLLLGESGSGKTFVARLIHEGSPWAREPLRVVNCAAIPENLVESVLFGHERGAFTGADVARPGIFEAAGRGTVLLDEIGELPLASQAKLLRVLEDRVFERVGSQKNIPLKARVLAATNRDLELSVREGIFRSDLFYRISVVTIRIPPLRERGDDVVVLARRLLLDLASATDRRVDGFADDALQVLREYSWPGNVRELRNALEHALVLGDGPHVAARDFPMSVRATKPRAQPDADEDTVLLPMPLEELEARGIDSALRACGGNRTRAAALLGISRVTLYKKLRDPA